MLIDFYETKVEVARSMGKLYMDIFHRQNCSFCLRKDSIHERKTIYMARPDLGNDEDGTQCNEDTRCHDEEMSEWNGS